MVSWVLCVVALCATGALAGSSNTVNKLDVETLSARQGRLLLLFSHIQEPNPVVNFAKIASEWSIEKNIDQYGNKTAAMQYVSMMKNKWVMPRNVPYAVYEPAHNIETITVFEILYSAKTYDTFFNTALYLRDITNEGLYVYALSVAILHRADCQGLTIPPIYETFPNFFVDADIILTAQRINAQGKDLVDKYPSTYIKNGDVVIKADDSAWTYTKNKLDTTNIFTHDPSLNALYYYDTLLYPYWLSSSVVPGLKKDRRGEQWWYNLKQIVARYYMERLSNGLGEIPALTDEISEGYSPNLLYGNGVPFPSRPDNFNLKQNKFVTKLDAAKEFERRIWEAIEKGYYYNTNGEQVSLKSEDSADVIGLLIQSNADSPNSYFYKDFLRLYAFVVGNNVYDSVELYNEFAPLVVPSVIENYQTALRDPAYYIVLKRILNLMNSWNKIVRFYTPEQLIEPGVQIEKVETDKLVTFYEKAYLNLTNSLPLNPAERAAEGLKNDVTVVAEYTRLNHNRFTVRINVKSEAAKNVVVKFFLAPKYDSRGFEINMRHNTENYFQFEEFVYDLKAGDNLIERKSTDNEETVKDWLSSYELWQQLEKGTWKPQESQFVDKFPHHLLLPKGTVNGMKFQLVVYMKEYKPAKVPYGTGFDPETSMGLGSGARYLTDDALGFPVNRPLYAWQVWSVKNLAFTDVTIFHEE